MKFLVDVCVSNAAAGFLQTAGHDVQRVGDVNPRLSDEEILGAAFEQSRIVVTQDKDFGSLVFVERLQHAGMIRLPHVRPEEQVRLLRQIVENHAEDLTAGAIVTAGRDRIRIRRRR